MVLLCTRGDLPNLHTKQTLAQILQVLSIPYNMDTTAFLIQACSKAMQLEAGIVEELLRIPLLFHVLITLSWLKHVWQMLQECNICLSCNIATILPPQQGDIKLMCLFTQVGFYSADPLILLNLCWMFHKVFWLLDICNEARGMLDPSFWNQHNGPTLHGYGCWLQHQWQPPGDSANRHLQLLYTYLAPRNWHTPLAPGYHLI